jgi:RNA polymerase sigma-70 factor (ECF subfamily)
VALNTAISNFRKESKKPDNVSISVYDFEIPAMPGTDLNENMSMLYMAINHLSEIEKAIILLYLDEKTYDEISEIIGITNTNVGARLNRIKTKLSKLIKTAL